VGDIEYTGEELGDVATSESSESESGSVVQESAPTHSIIRQRAEIKVLSEPTPPQNDLQ
jgi:hypothetical protein